MGKLISSKRYLYIANGAGLSPNINGLRFYDSGLIQLGIPIYYDETNTYKLRSLAGLWGLSRIDNTIGDFVRFNSSILGDYTAANGWSGTLTISEYKNKISIKKQNLGGGKIIAPRKSKYELILTISPTNEVYKIYTDNIDPMGFYGRTSKNEYNIDIVKDDGSYWYVHFRNINDGDYCNSFGTSDNDQEDFRDVNWDIYYYKYQNGCPNLNYTRLDIIINQRY